MEKFLIIICLLSTSAYSQGISFIKEDITFRLDKNYFIVEGLYWFVSTSDKEVEKLIFYPFAINSDSEEINSVEVFNQSKNYKVALIDKIPNGIKFLLRGESQDTIIYRITYTQRVITDSVKYILTSTSEWGHTLITAEYKLIVKDTFKIKSFSYEPEQIYALDGNKIFYWKKNDFMPAADMVFYFDPE